MPERVAWRSELEALGLWPVGPNARWARLLGWAGSTSAIADLVGLKLTPSDLDAPEFLAGIRRWQGQRRQVADGILGPETWRVMQQVLGRTGSPGH